MRKRNECMESTARWKVLFCSHFSSSLWLYPANLPRLRKCLLRKVRAKVENNHMLNLLRCKEEGTRKKFDNSFCRPTRSVTGWKWIDCHKRKGLWLKVVKQPQGTMDRKRMYKYQTPFLHEIFEERTIEKLAKTYTSQYK